MCGLSKETRKDYIDIFLTICYIYLGGSNMLCKITRKNQVTLPKKILERFGKVTYFDAESDENRIILTAVAITPIKKLNLSDIQNKIYSLGISEKDIEAAVKWARKK